MTRESGSCALPGSTKKQCLDNRSDFALEKGAEMLVSLHINATATGNGSASGALVFIPDTDYNSAVGVKARDIANSILAQVSKLGLTNLGPQTNKSYKENELTPYYNPDGTLADYYNICRESKWKGFPGLIVEHGFLDNYSDYTNYLNTDEKLYALGIADAHGIMDYLGVDY